MKEKNILSEELVITSFDKSAIDVIIKQVNESKEFIMNLKIKGIDDKPGFETVNSAKNKIVRVRTAIDGLRKKMNEKYQLKIKANNEAAGVLQKLIEPIESHLQGQVKAIKLEEERIKLEAELKQEQIYLDRTKQLRDFDMVFTGSDYTGFGLIIPIHDIKSFDEIQFKGFVEKVETMYDELEVEKMAEEKKAKEDKIEADRLKKKNIELEAKLAALEPKEEKKEELDYGLQEVVENNCIAPADVKIPAMPKCGRAADIGKIKAYIEITRSIIMPVFDQHYPDVTVCYNNIQQELLRLEKKLNLL